MPSGKTSFQFVTVGDPGNAPDSTGYGSVPYTYQMGEFDVTVAQYTQFLNAVASTDPYGLYDPSMNPNSSIGSCGIYRNGSAGSYTYTYASTNANFPVNFVSWGSVARFCNWLDNGQLDTGEEKSSTTEDGSYDLNGAVTDQQLDAITRTPNATYAIPTENEWYKAAYYKSGSANAGYWQYPTRSDSGPSNSLSITGTNNANYDNGGFTDPTTFLTSVGTFMDSPGPYGTFDMGGNVYEWTEGFDKNVRTIRGGSWNDGMAGLASDTFLSDGPSQENVDVGFRVVELPEPGIAGLVGFVYLMTIRSRRPNQR
jgi:formylglycine-generating enzyme